MPIRQIVQGVYTIPGPVNIFLLESLDGLVLIDTGEPDSATQILNAIREAGKQPTDIQHILVTHWHPDHMGSLAAIKAATGAQAYAPPQDAPIIRNGGDFDPSRSIPRPFTPAPGMEELYRQFIRPVSGVEGAHIEHEITEGNVLPFLPELKIIYTPGHSHGHLALLLENHGGILFAADACSNFAGLNWSILYEDFEEGKRSLKMLCDYNFEIATFGHGDVIMSDAATQWRKRWGEL